MFKILFAIVSVVAATYAEPSSEEIKEACYSGDVDKANCAKVLALSIVAHSRDCFSTAKGVEADYKTCTVNFCDAQCNKNEACSDLCSQKAAGLFEKLKPAPAMVKVAEHKPDKYASEFGDLVTPSQNKSQPVLPKVAGSIATKVENKAPTPEKKEATSTYSHEYSDLVTPKNSSKTAPKPGKNHTSFMQKSAVTRRAPEDELAKEMTHDLEMNFNKIAPFGKEDTAKELQDHAAKTQDTLVDAVENAEVAEIKRAVFRALTRLRAATIKEFDTIARLETQAIDAYNDAHHYRAENPLTHLHEDEAPVETDKLKSFH